jgi:hypothetical protein
VHVTYRMQEVDVLRSKGLWIGVCAAGILAGSAHEGRAAALMTERNAKSQEKRLEEVRALTIEDVIKRIVVDDDDLETVATIKTTEAFLPKRGSFFDTLIADNMLRAMVSKATGRTQWQLYQTIHYTDPDWRNLTSVNYETPTGPRSVQVTVISTDVQCNYGICSYDEIVGFNMDEQLLEAIVARNAGKTDAVWRFKFNARNGIDWKDDLPVAEIAGALLAVKRYRQQKGFE